MTSAVDFGDYELYANGVPYELFARLRREAPIDWSRSLPEEIPRWQRLLGRFPSCRRADGLSASRHILVRDRRNNAARSQTQIWKSFGT